MGEGNSAKKTFNTPEGAFTVFSIYQRQAATCGFHMKGRTILNIGAGDLIGLDILFLLSGARRVISIDLQPGNYHYPRVSGQSPFFERLWGIVSEAGMAYGPVPWEGILMRNGGDPRYNTDRLFRLSPSSACHLPLKNDCVDFAFSNAVFEHIEDPEGAIEEIARTLSPGGQTMHRVDLRDHRDFSKPLEFLKPREPSGGCNLWRAHQFEEAFKNCGLEVRLFDVFDQFRVTREKRGAFKKPFNNLSCRELGKLRFMIYAVKNTSPRVQRQDHDPVYGKTVAQ